MAMGGLTVIQMELALGPSMPCANVISDWLESPLVSAHTKGIYFGKWYLFVLNYQTCILSACAQNDGLTLNWVNAMPQYKSPPGEMDIPLAMYMSLIQGIT